MLLWVDSKEKPVSDLSNLLNLTGVRGDEFDLLQEHLLDARYVADYRCGALCVAFLDVSNDLVN